jgi:hypothetical protein
MVAIILDYNAIEPTAAAQCSRVHGPAIIESGPSQSFVFKQAFVNTIPAAEVEYPPTKVTIFDCVIHQAVRRRVLKEANRAAKIISKPTAETRLGSGRRRPEYGVRKIPQQA